MEVNNYYVYELIDPRNGLCFYVGKSKNKTRLFDHTSRVKNNGIPNGNKHLYYKIKNILDCNLEIIYNTPYQNLSNEDAIKYEIELIDFHGRKNLTNLTNGGDSVMSGMKHTDDAKRKIGIASRNRIISDETRKRCGLVNKGRKRSEETCLKIGASKSNPLEETRKKLSIAAKGRKAHTTPHSDETKEKIREKRKLQLPLSTESRKKLSDSITEWWKIRKLNKKG